MVMLAKIVREYGGFAELSAHIGTTNLEAFCDGAYKKFCHQFAEADYETGVEWVIRQYQAAKKIALCALFITQADALQRLSMKNLRYYCCYYALFNALSSNLLVHPNVTFARGRDVSHASLFKDIENFFIRFGIYESATLSLLSDLRYMREAYSYHLPLSGTAAKLGSLTDDELSNQLHESLPRILQISNLLSMLAYCAWEAKSGKPLDESLYAPNRDFVDGLFFSTLVKKDHLKNRLVLDDGDYKQLGYALNKIAQPFPISWFIEDKLVDDLEEAWDDGEERGSSAFEIERVSKYIAAAIG